MALINIQKVLLTAFTCTIFTLYYDVGNTHGLVQNVIPNNNSNSKTNEINEYAQHLKTKIARSEAKSERRRKERESHVSREKCSSCQRPPILCVCEALPSKRIVTSTKILVLQHPNEFKRKSLSTVPLMPLVLHHCDVKVGYNFEPESLDLVKKYLDEGKKPLLLFPGPDAISLDVEYTHHNKGVNLQHQHSDGQLLILVDGTWAEARRMLLQSPKLVDVCQQVQFSLENESIYDIVRKEPEKHCISTLEACAESLILLEPDKEIATDAKNSLEAVMKHMVNIKRKVYEMRNVQPRFVRPGMKGSKRAEAAFRYEQTIFGNK